MITRNSTLSFLKKHRNTSDRMHVPSE